MILKTKVAQEFTVYKNDKNDLYQKQTVMSTNGDKIYTLLTEIKPQYYLRIYRDCAPSLVRRA